MVVNYGTRKEGLSGQKALERDHQGKNRERDAGTNGRDRGQGTGMWALRVSRSRCGAGPDGRSSHARLWVPRTDAGADAPKPCPAPGWGDAEASHLPPLLTPLCAHPLPPPRGPAYHGFELHEGDGGAVEEVRGQPALLPTAVPDCVPWGTGNREETLKFQLLIMLVYLNARKSRLFSGDVNSRSEAQPWVGPGPGRCHGHEALPTSLPSCQGPCGPPSD